MEEAQDPAAVALPTHLVFPGGPVQWLTSHGGLGTDSLFHLQMEQGPSESARRKKAQRKKIYFHRQVVIEEPFSCGRKL